MIENYTWLQNSIERFLVKQEIKKAELKYPNQSVYATCNIGVDDEIEVCVSIQPDFRMNYTTTKSKHHFTPREALLAFISGDKE